MTKNIAIYTFAAFFISGCQKNLDFAPSSGITNGSFEVDNGEKSSWSDVTGWHGSEGTISSNPSYNAVDGNHFVLLPGESNWISQTTTTSIQAGNAYMLTLYASNGTPVDNNTQTKISIELFSGDTLIITTQVDVTVTTEAAMWVEEDAPKQHILNENHAYIPIGLKFYADDFPALEGENIGVRIRNSGSPQSLLAIDSIRLKEY